MKIPDFKLEEFWKKYEFTAPYLLCCSDAETWTLQELLAIADEDSKKLWQSLALGYTESPGHPLLRQEIARFYSSVKADEILTFAEDLVRTEGILIMPGSVFELPGNFFRIGFGKRNMLSILERFESYLQRQTWCNKQVI